MPYYNIQVLTKQLKKQNGLLSEMHIAKELGMSLARLRDEMTPGELWLWVAYFTLQNEEHDAAMKKSSRRR